MQNPWLHSSVASEVKVRQQRELQLIQPCDKHVSVPPPHLSPLLPPAERLCYARKRAGCAPPAACTHNKMFRAPGLPRPRGGAHRCRAREHT